MKETKVLVCPWCGSTNKEHTDHCPDSGQTRRETIGMPAYMNAPRVSKQKIESKEHEPTEPERSER